MDTHTDSPDLEDSLDELIHLMARKPAPPQPAAALRPPAPAPAPALSVTVLLDRYFQRYPHTRAQGGQLFRCQAGLWSPLPSDQFQHEIHLLLDDTRLGGVRLARLLALRVRARLAAQPPLGPPAVGALACANGLLDLATAQLRPLTPADSVTSALPYDFDPAARCPVWETYLQSRLPDSSEFLQEFAGYCLTPDTRYELALWLYGRPGTGKSTFLKGLETLLGPFAGSLAPNLLLAGRFSPAQVLGKTLLTCAEPPPLNLARAAQFNAFVTGEAITAEPKYGQAQSILPAAKLAWAFTALPPVSDASSPLFRRVAIVPLPPFPSDQHHDAGLKSRLAAEGPGLLNWALAGLARLTARGRFVLPPAVAAATRAYQTDNDIAAQFLADRCELGAEYSVPADRLLKAYTAYRLALGHSRPANNTLARDWERLGLQRRQLDNRRYWFGVRLPGLFASPLSGKSPNPFASSTR
jgi:putative DNA primase/helicase